MFLKFDIHFHKRNWTVVKKISLVQCYETIIIDFLLFVLNECKCVFIYVKFKWNVLINSNPKKQEHKIITHRKEPVFFLRIQKWFIILKCNKTSHNKQTQKILNSLIFQYNQYFFVCLNVVISLSSHLSYISTLDFVLLLLFCHYEICSCSCCLPFQFHYRCLFVFFVLIKYVD